jgi:hypothetical protein
MVDLSWGIFKAAKAIVSERGFVKIVFLIALISTLSGCATPTRSLQSSSCNESDFVPSLTACLECKKEVCKDGKIVLVEDLAPTAPVNDWAEERFCLRHPINCYKAYAFKHNLEQWQKDLVGKYWADEGLHNGLGDGARHAYLMCELTERYGVDFARALGVAHEEDSEYLIFVQMGVPGNPCCEKATDLYNNEIGIMLAGKPGSCEEKTLRSLHLLRHSLCTTRDKAMER